MFRDLEGGNWESVQCLLLMGKAESGELVCPRDSSSSATQRHNLQKTPNLIKLIARRMRDYVVIYRLDILLQSPSSIDHISTKPYTTTLQLLLVTPTLQAHAQQLAAH
uniref:Uncharacterized protein n=1 Tax=Fusarium oxysporum (strain Fo5176) TaxID=660025 RepID=A0A0D2Y733_FUSOF